MKKQEKYDWMVCARCITFNHAPYIVDAMNGFAIQETTFPFVCCIVDDASTDGEQEVISNYLEEHFDLEDKKVVRYEETDDYLITFARHKTNLNCFFAVIFLKYNHYSIKKPKIPYIAEWFDKAKYIAICEGDDYWIDNNKLQKQVEVLEKDSSIGLCYTNASKYLQKENIITQNKDVDNKGSRDLIFCNPIMTLTTLYRTCLYMDYIRDINPSSHNWKMGDYPLWLYIGFENKLYYIDEITAVYRVLQESASHSHDYKKKIDFAESTRNIRLFFAEKYNMGIDTINHINDIYYREISLQTRKKDHELYHNSLRNIKQKNIKEIIKYLLSAIRLKMK